MRPHPANLYKCTRYHVPILEQEHSGRFDLLADCLLFDLHRLLLVMKVALHVSSGLHVDISGALPCDIIRE
jgi:hypothetical protein